MNKILALLFVAAVLIQVNARPGPEDGANETPSTPEKSKAGADTATSTGNQKSNPMNEIGRTAEEFAPMMKKAVDVIPKAILSFSDTVFKGA